MSAPTEPDREQGIDAIAIQSAWEAEARAFDAWLADVPRKRAESRKAYREAKAHTEALIDAYRAKWGNR